MSHVWRSSMFRFVVLVVACATLSVAAFAQSTVTGSIAGTVVNVAGKPGGDYELLAVDSQEVSRSPLHLETRDGAALRLLPLPYELPQPQPQSATDGE